MFLFVGPSAKIGRVYDRACPGIFWRESESKLGKDYMARQVLLVKQAFTLVFAQIASAFECMAKWTSPIYMVCEQCFNLKLCMS